MYHDFRLSSIILLTSKLLKRRICRKGLFLQANFSKRLLRLISSISSSFFIMQLKSNLDSCSLSFLLFSSKISEMLLICLGRNFSLYEPFLLLSRTILFFNLVFMYFSLRKERGESGSMLQSISHLVLSSRTKADFSF